MRLGKRSFEFENSINILSGYSIVGPKEAEGNFGKEFDIALTDDLWEEKSYEKCECKMHREAIKGAIKKAGIETENVDLILAGDLLNEISASNFAAREFNCSFLGLYNACSTFGEAIIIASIFLNSGNFETISCSTSSHFSSAERQYRFPLELGNQRTPTAQWTVTGAGCAVLSRKSRETVKSNVQAVKTEKVDAINSFEVRVTSATIGRVIDMGIEDESNMGAAMAPAAADTLITHFKETGRAPSYYDAILTGDLGLYGKELLVFILKDEGVTLPDYYEDCGAVYFKEEQKCVQGGSGAGCSSTAFCSHFLNKLMRGELKKVLLVPTGALLNKDTPLQKETIPSIAHAVAFESFEIK